MFSRFLKNNIECIPLTLLLGILLRIPFYLSQSEGQDVTIFSNVSIHLSALWLHVIVYIICTIQAFWINQLIVRENILQRNNFLPFLLCTMLLASQPEMQRITPPLLANFFYILVFASLIRLQKGNKNYAAVFNVGVFVGFASFYYFPAVAGLLLLYFFFVFLRTPDWREWLIPLIGWMLPYYIILSVAYITDNYTWMAEIISDFRVLAYNGLQWEGVLRLMPFAGILVFALSYLRVGYSANTVFLRNNMQLQIAAVFISVASLGLSRSTEETHFILIIFPFSVIVGNYLIHIRRAWVLEGIMWLLLLSVLVFNIWSK